MGGIPSIAEWLCLAVELGAEKNISKGEKKKKKEKKVPLDLGLICALDNSNELGVSYSYPSSSPIP